MRALIIAFACASAPAAADSVGLAVTGDPELQSSVQDTAKRWLAGRGHVIAGDALPGDAVATIADCYVIEDGGCAQAVIDKRARHAIVFVTVERSGNDIRVTGRWLVKGQQARVQLVTCTRCEATLAPQIEAALAGVVTATATDPVVAPANVGVREHAHAHHPHGLAIGVELGEPTAATIGWFAGRFGVAAGVGSGTFEGPGLAVHASAHFAVTELRPQVPLHVGLGGRMYRHGYSAMSIDELPDTHVGVFASVGVAIARGPLELYFELAPGLDVSRSRSCTFADGPRTICPHAQETPLFIDFAIGARWFLSH